MLFLYNVSVWSYFVVIYIFSFFKHKAKLWIEGRQGLFEKLGRDFENNTVPVLWLHCASLGEFEQGKPVLEQLKASREFENYKIFITFFSPSGYEVRKNYSKADFVYYLPLDTQKNAKRFLDIVKPSLVLWVRYEFWYYYLKAIQERQIPLILFSATFRESQLFFKNYGGLFKQLLRGFVHIFVQDSSSKKLLQSIGNQRVSIAKDTRFDRVEANAKEASNIPLVEKFKDEEVLFILGSARRNDLKVILPVLQKLKQKVKLIIAPHEIEEKVLRQIEKALPRTLRFSRASLESIQHSEVLIIDSVGLLASLYRYGNIAYIGGAFDDGLHNILEPAAFSLPIVFGEKYSKFSEAKDLIEQGAAFSIKDEKGFEEIFLCLYEHVSEREKAGRIAKNYINENLGGTEKIVSYLQSLKLDT